MMIVKDTVDFRTYAQEKLDAAGVGRLIFLALAGSHAYGLQNADSDVDLRGVYLPTRASLLGLHARDHVTEQGPGRIVDFQALELRHFLRLCMKGSPLQMEMLFSPRDVVLVRESEWDVFNGNWFVGKHLAKSLGGYAQSDLHAITTGSTRKLGKRGKEIAAEHGYAVKSGANALRLLYMQRRLWTSGWLHVRPEGPEANHIIDVRAGRWAKEFLVEFCAGLERTCEMLRDGSSIQAGPEVSRIEAACVEVLAGVAGTV